MTLLRPRSLLALLGTAALAAACTTQAPGTRDGSDGDGDGDERVGDGDQRVGDIDQYIESLEDLPVAEPQDKTEIPCADACPDSTQEGDLFCTYRRFTETVRYDKFVAFQPNSATLWPGAIVRGADAQEGVLTPVGVALAPVTFSVSLENIAGSPVGEMDEPSLSAFRDERNRILSADVTGATPAALDYQVIEVHSQSQIGVAIGGGLHWPGGEALSASFNFDSSDKKTKILVNFTQAYYTIDVDTPTHPSDFFDESVTVDDLEESVDDSSPPLYVQSITYGRRVIFSVETDETVDDIKAALEATYTGAISANASVSSTYQDMLSKSNIKAFVMGGSGGDATGVVNGFDGLVGYIKKGGDYTKDSPGAPIAYKLAYLDNVTAQMAFTTDYSERECVKNRAKLRVELTGLDHLGGGDVGGTLELFGNLSIRYPTEGSPVHSCTSGGKLVDLWDVPDGSWINVDEMTSWAPPSPIYLYLHDVPIEEGQRLCLSAHLWEEDGDTWELSGDDDLGTGLRDLLAEDGWAGDHVVQVRGSGNEAIDLHVTIDVE
jgi:thiol-activated cytolysin